MALHYWAHWSAVVGVRKRVCIYHLPHFRCPPGGLAVQWASGLSSSFTFSFTTQGSCYHLFSSVIVSWWVPLFVMSCQSENWLLAVFLFFFLFFFFFGTAWACGGCFSSFCLLFVLLLLLPFERFWDVFKWQYSYLKSKSDASFWVDLCWRVRSPLGFSSISVFVCSFRQ